MRLTVSATDLAASVMAVPPLARTADGAFDEAANRTLIDHMEKGGVKTLLYGGNALAHHWPISRYADWLDRLEALVAEDTWLLPSVGSDGGRLIDQAALLADRRFPVALLLPMIPPRTADGTREALRRFHGESGVRLLVYIKTDGYIPARDLEILADQGAVFGVKYAVPRSDPSQRDAYLDDLIASIGRDRIISGFGEPPAIHHMMDYRLAGFTAGCVCIAPSISMSILGALNKRDRDLAEQLVAPLMPLERLRNRINEIRVLHDAIGLSGLVEMGPILAPSSHIPEDKRNDVAEAATELLAAERAHRTALAA